MMLSKVGSTNGDDDGNSNSGQLLRDIEAISKALYLQKTPHKALISSSTRRSKSAEKPRLSESKSSLNPRTLDANVSYKDKKSTSLWNWKKPLKALAHIRHQRFNVCFFLHVHSIEGLPPSFNDMSLSVHWKRKDEMLQTSPSRVVKGIAEFDETLMHTCSIYGSRSGPQHSAKYEVKLFSIYASVIGAVGVDMGMQWVDLTRLLPLSLEELEREKSTGKWTTTFKLAGKAKGATLNVSLGFSVFQDNLIETGKNMNVSELVDLVHNRSCTAEQITGVGRTNSDLNCRAHVSCHSVDVKVSDEVSPKVGMELSKSISFLYQKLNEANLHSSEEFHTLSEYAQPLKLKSGLEFESDKDIGENECHEIEFTVIEKGIEMSKKEDLESKDGTIRLVDGCVVETIDVDEIVKDDMDEFIKDDDVKLDVKLDGETKFHYEDNISANYVDEVLVDDCKHEENSNCENRCIMEDLELAFNSFLTLESTKLESGLAIGECLEQESYVETKSNYKAGKVVKKSLSLDQITESVANDFLNMLGIEHSPFGPHSDSDPESPRERLLREFEKEAIASGNFIIEYDENGKHEEFGCIAPLVSNCRDLSADFDFFKATQAAEKKHERTNQLLSRRKAKVLEDLETETLMKQWGLNEEAFQNSPRYCSDGFGSPVELLSEERNELPPLGDGFGSFIQTKNGGYLRSMNPSVFRNSKNVGSLIIQVSCPVVLAAEMGSDIIEILQKLASIGIERLSQHTNKLMPLEDITGKTLQQIAQDAAPVRQAPLCHESLLGKSTLLGAEMSSDYTTLEYLTSLAMDKIEAMSIEGLKIQSGMSEEEAPSSMCSQFFKNTSLGWFLSLEGAAELRELDAKDIDIGIDDLLDLSITLEEWLRLDGGDIGDEDQVSERTVKILAAHHARCVDFINGRSIRDINWDKVTDRRHGLLGNNLTLALRMLLRDPLRNYEPVGASMLAIVQMRRLFFRLKPALDSTALERRKDEAADHEWIKGEDGTDDRLKEEESSIGFKITDVHVSGLNAEPGKPLYWGTKRQQQYGIRWLLASGMSKSSKHPCSKSTAIVVSSSQLMRKLQNNDFLWSISSKSNTTESNWKELTGFVSHKRNPNVFFSK